MSWSYAFTSDQSWRPRPKQWWSSSVIASLVLAIACVPKAGVGSELRINTPDVDADVYVDGNYVGQVAGINDARTGGLGLAPGVHRIEVRKLGRFPVQKTVEIPRRPQPYVTVDAVLLEDPQ